MRSPKLTGGRKRPPGGPPEMLAELTADAAAALTEELDLVGEEIAIAGRIIRGIFSETEEAIALTDRGAYRSPKNASITIPRADADAIKISPKTVIAARGIRWRADAVTVRSASVTIELVSRDADD